MKMTKYRKHCLKGEDAENQLFSYPEHKVLGVIYCDLSTIYKCKPISTKLGKNVGDHKISYVFDHGSNWTRKVRLICP